MLMKISRTFMNRMLYRRNLTSEETFRNRRMPIKSYEKCFLSHLKALLVLKIFKFLSSRFGHVEKRLRKIRLILNFITS